MVKTDLEPFGPGELYESVHYGGDRYEAEIIERNNNEADEK